MMPDTKKLIQDIHDLGRHFRGRRELIAHYQGKPLSRKQAMEAWCYDCSGFYDQGAADCECPNCPLHPFMPYRTDKGPKKPRSQKQVDAATQLGQRSKEKGSIDTVKHVPTGQNDKQGI